MRRKRQREPDGYLGPRHSGFTPAGTYERYGLMIRSLRRYRGGRLIALLVVVAMIGLPILALINALTGD